MKQINESSREARMQQSFAEAVQRILNHPDRYRTDPRSITVGLESEVAIIPRDLELAFKELTRCGIYAPGAFERLARRIAHGPPSAALARALGGRERVTNEEMVRALESCSMFS